MAFTTIRDLPLPDLDPNSSNRIVPDDLLVICDQNGSNTLRISVAEMMTIGLTFSESTDGLVPGPTAADIGNSNGEFLRADGS